jgi:hypothetical protein
MNDAIDRWTNALEPESSEPGTFEADLPGVDALEAGKNNNILPRFIQ